MVPVATVTNVEMARPLPCCKTEPVTMSTPTDRNTDAGSAEEEATDAGMSEAAADSGADRRGGSDGGHGRRC